MQYACVVRACECSIWFTSFFVCACERMRECGAQRFRFSAGNVDVWEEMLTEGVCASMRMCERVCVRMWSADRKCASVCVCAHIRAHIRAYVHIYIRACVHTYIRAYVHIFVRFIYWECVRDTEWQSSRICEWRYYGRCAPMGLWLSALCFKEETDACFLLSFPPSFIHPTIPPSLHLFIHSFVYLSISPSTHSFIHLSLYLSIYSSIHPSCIPLSPVWSVQARNCRLWRLLRKFLRNRLNLSSLFVWLVCSTEVILFHRY